jgi:hypothetical protein
MKVAVLQRTKYITLVYTAWWMAWAVPQAYAIYKSGYTWADALTDAAITQGTLAAFAYILNRSWQYYRPSPANSAYIVIGSFMVAAVSVVVQKELLAVFIHTAGYLEFIDRTLIFRTLFSGLVMALVVMAGALWMYWRDQQQNVQQKLEAEQQFKQAELSTLRLQLQPHFLFNSLNSISALVGSQPDKARQMIEQLSDFLRGSLRGEGQSLNTFRDELQHLQLYLDIEKVRFGHRLQVTINCPPDCEGLLIPSLLLQPIMENAIKHGLYNTTGAVELTVNAQKVAHELKVSVQNPFDPSAPLRSGTGFGLSSIQRRLYLLYSRNDLLLTQQAENTFITTVKIPQA